MFTKINHSDLQVRTYPIGSSRRYPAELVKAAKQHKNKNLTGWRVVAPPASEYAAVYHFSTCMLYWNVNDPTDIEYDLGHGSVSDQTGMNGLFYELGLNLFYSRAGGAHIELYDMSNYEGHTIATFD